MSFIINQPAGLGDIIFSMTMVRSLIEEYGDCTWPVEKQWIEGLKTAYQDIQFISRDDLSPMTMDFNRHDYYDIKGLGTVIPLRWSREIMHEKPQGYMRSKYSMFRCDWQDWTENGEYP